ncbi:MAG TPA: hypothetical protein VNG29_00370 [Candidatus Paceibacterota bacterium]|nr:hypothetical protein [Candidatus Paceibacterota bacterium]
MLRITYRIIFIAAIISSFLFIQEVRAQTAPPASQNGGCTLNQDEFVKLAAVENDPTLGYLAELTQELQIRKELLSETMDCAIAQATALQTSLAAISTPDAGVKAARAQAKNLLGNAITYYGLQKSNIPNLGIQGSKNFAASLEAWRAGNYAPVAKEASDILIWTGNQNLIVTAQTRMNQMGHTMGILDLAGESNLTALWSDAQANFKATLNFNDAARAALGNGGGPDEALGDIKLSLDALSVAYQKLSDMNNVITNSTSSAQSQ